MAGLSEIALKIEECKKDIEKIMVFKERCKMKNSYIALIEPETDTLWDKDIIHRYHNIEGKMKTFIIKECNKEIKKQNDKILEHEKEIIKSTIASIAEDSQLPEKEKRNFFNKLFKG